MDASKLAVLLAAIQNGSMQKTSEQYGYTPSAISHMMDAFEAEYGIRIVDRGSYGIRLNANGAALLPQIQAVVTQEQLLRGRITELLRQEEQSLSIGSYPSIAREWLMDAVFRFRRIHPEIAIEIRTGSYRELSGLLREGKLHMFFSGFRPREEFPFLPLMQDSLRALVPGTGHWADAEFFPAKDFETCPFILPIDSDDTENAEILAQFAIHPKPIAQTTDLPVVLSMVAKGMGVSICSQMGLRDVDPRVRVLPIVPDVCRTIGICRPVSRKAAKTEQLFLSFIQKLASDTP